MAAREVFLGLGSNQGDKIQLLNHACDLINNQLGSIIKKSSFFNTQPWGKVDQDNFVNQVIRIWTEIEPKIFLDILQSIELSMGRVRNEKWAARTIDIDILYFGQLIIDTEILQIPHPELTERRFVLEPLCEIAPDFLHPIFKLSNNELLAFCEDTLQVSKIENAA